MCDFCVSREAPLDEILRLCKKDFIDFNVISSTWTLLLCEVAKRRFYFSDPVEHSLALYPVI